MSKKLAVLFPGMGYTTDMPLMYYTGKLLANNGYELKFIKFRDFPKKVAGDKTLLIKAAEIAISQAAEQLDATNLSEYDDVVFAGKSIGTIAASDYVYKHDHNVRQIWLTPLEETFPENIDATKVLAFIGTKDPWSDLSKVKAKAAALNIDLHLYDGCNHSLECSDTLKNIDTLKDVITKIEGRFLSIS